MLAYQYADETPLAAASGRMRQTPTRQPYGGGNYDSYYTYPGNILNPVPPSPITALRRRRVGRRRR